MLPPGFSITNRVINEPPKKLGMEELLQQFIAINNAKAEKFGNDIGELGHGLGIWASI